VAALLPLSTLQRRSRLPEAVSWIKETGTLIRLIVARIQWKLSVAF